MGVQDWDLTKRIALVASTAVIKGTHIGFSIPNRESHVGELLACDGVKGRRKQKNEEDNEKLRNIAPELRQRFGTFAELCRHNSKISKKNGKKYRRNVGKTIGCQFRSRNSFWAIGRNREYPSCTVDMTQAGVTASTSVVATGASSSSASAAAPPPAQPQINTLCEIGSSAHLVKKLTSPGPKFLVCSFGTRTLQNVIQHPPSRLMYSACWGLGGDKRATIPSEYMEHCMRESWGLKDDVKVRMCFIDCRSLYEPKISDGKHVGLHEKLQWGYVLQCDATDVIDQLRNGLAKLADTTLFGFYCNAGEHRSVAMAELFSHYLLSAFPQARVDLRHVCHSIWRRRYCGGCADCMVRTGIHQQALQALNAQLSRPRSPGR